MKKLVLLIFIAALAPMIFSPSTAKSASKDKVRVRKITPVSVQRAEQEKSRLQMINNLPTYQGKVEFNLAQNDYRSPAQFGAKKGDTVVIQGEKVDSSKPLDKAKFAAASIEDITSENFPQIIESFDYPNADILEIVKAISELTGKNFIVDPGVRGKVTIIAPTKITVAEAYKAFLSALAINGFTIVKMGPFLKIRSARNAQRDNIETYSGDYYPDSDQMITRIIHLKHISAEEVSKNLRIIPSKDGEMSPYPPTNSLIISDFGANVDRVSKIIKQLDIPGFEEKMEVIPVRFATAADLATLIEQILSKGESGGSSSRSSRRSSRRSGSFSSGIPRFGGNNNSSSEVISIAVPDERTNSLIVVGNQAGIDRIRRLVARLDFKLRPEDSGGVRVYYVKHGEAEKIEQTLSGLANESSKQQQTSSRRSSRRSAPVEQQDTPLFGGNVKIAADKATNSLIITASKQDYEVVHSILEKIDIPRDQVYVKSVILEMNADDQNTYGVSYFKFDGDTGGIGRAGFNSGNLNQLLDPSTEGGILGFGAGETFDLEVSGQTFTVKSLVGFINFLTTHTESQVLSTPQIIAMNNEEAEIEVGQDVPVSLNSSQNGTTTAANVQREKATIKLMITPFLSPDSDLVRLKVEQTVRSLSNSSVAASQLAQIAVSLDDRSIKTNIAVQSGNTAVLGGLISNTITETEKKVPLLGDIPIIGWLFRSTQKQKKRNNLFVFLSPKIVRSQEDANEIVNDKLDQRLSFIQKNFGGRDPYGQHMDKLTGGISYENKGADGREDEIVEETLAE